MTALTSLAWLAALLAAPALDQAPPPPQPAANQFPARPDPAAVRARELAGIEAEMRTIRATVRDELTDTVANQEVAARQAELDWKRATLEREKCQYAVREYAEGTYRLDRETLLGEVALAQADVDRADEQARSVEQARVRGGKISRRQETIQLLAAERAKFALEQAQTDLEILEKYTRDRTIKRLEATVGEAEATELVRKNDYDAGLRKLERRRQQSARLQARGPEDFVVALLDEVAGQEAQVAAIVREIAALNDRIAADPDHADKIIPEVAAKREAVRSLAAVIKASLLDATEVADEARQSRQSYLQGEKNLIQARERLGIPSR